MNWIIKKLDWANKYLTPICTILAGFTGILWEKDFSDFILEEYPQRTGLYDLLNEYIPISFIVLSIAAGIFGSLRIFTQRTITSLERSLNEEKGKVDLVVNNIETLFKGMLLKLSEKINFLRGEPSRITVYIHNQDGSFISFGRYSPDPNYDSKGRSLLPDDEGCIAKAWSQAWCFEGNLSYKNSRKKYNIDEEAYRQQRMKSVFFAVKRIDGLNKQPLAVIVIESKAKDRFAEGNIKPLLDGEESYFSEIIGCLKEHIPDPNDATKRGF